MFIIQIISAAVALAFGVVIAIQSYTLGFARTSAMLITSGAMLTLVAANAAQVGVLNGTHVIGILTAAFLPWWSFVRTRAAEFQ